MNLPLPRTEWAWKYFPVEPPGRNRALLYLSGDEIINLLYGKLQNVCWLVDGADKNKPDTIEAYDNCVWKYTSTSVCDSSQQTFAEGSNAAEKCTSHIKKSKILSLVSTYSHQWK